MLLSPHCEDNTALIQILEISSTTPLHYAPKEHQKHKLLYQNSNQNLKKKISLTFDTAMLFFLLLFIILYMPGHMAIEGFTRIHETYTNLLSRLILHMIGKHVPT